MLMCDHTYCYTPAVLKIRELVTSGELGDVQYVDSVRVNLGLVQPDIDVLWDLAPHDLSILDFILPEEMRPSRVAAFGADPVGAGHTCVGYLTLPLAGNAVAHVHLNWLSPTKIRTTLIGGSKKMIVWDDLNPSQRISVYDRGVELRAAGRGRGPPAGPGRLPAGRHGGADPPRGRGAAGRGGRAGRQHPRGPGAPDRRSGRAPGPGAPRGGEPQPRDRWRFRRTGRGAVMGSPEAQRRRARRDRGQAGARHRRGRADRLDDHRPAAAPRAGRDRRARRLLPGSHGQPRRRPGAPTGSPWSRATSATRRRWPRSWTASTCCTTRPPSASPGAPRSPAWRSTCWSSARSTCSRPRSPPASAGSSPRRRRRSTARPTCCPPTRRHHPYHNDTIYGAAKVFNEGLLQSFHQMYGLDYVALRYFNVYGPRMDIYGVYTEVLVRWMERIEAGEPPLILGDGIADDGLRPGAGHRPGQHPRRGHAARRRGLQRGQRHLDQPGRAGRRPAAR